VASRRLSLVNREPGAEARSLLDGLREHEGVPADDLPGYAAEASGHLEVAAAIAAGLADVGPASEPAGLAYGLAFLPVASELAEMWIPAAMLDTPEVQALLRVLAARSLRAQVASLPGYDADLCGEVIWSA
jgi:molybdate-binding protein